MGNRDMQVLWIARYDYQPEWVLDEHDHDYYQMIYILSGKGTFYLEGNSHQMGEKMLFLIRPKVRHGLIAAKDETIKTLDIKFEVNNGGWKDFIGSCEPVICSCPKEIKGLLEKIREEGLERRPLYEKFSLLHLKEIFFHILRSESGKDTPNMERTNGIINACEDSLCNKVLEYYRDHYHEDITLKDMGNSLGYNQSYICQRFKDSFNCTPMQYLYRYRIYKAQELIMYSDFSLKQIAHMTGFKSIHHFTRVFKDLQGMAPGEFRDKERDGIRKDIYLDDTFINVNYTQKFVD